MKTVCVTGANGFIASMIVKMLLERGYTVHGTVRSTKDPVKNQHLLSLPNAERHLHLFEADLLADSSFDEAIKGCSGVFHCASPFQLSSTDGRKEFVEPALKGTQNVLASVNKTDSVKRVVLTSSIAAVAFNGGALPPSHVYTDKDFSHVQVLEERGIFYPLSKTLAELEAWDIVKAAEGRWDLVVCCPTAVFGPLLQPTLNASSSMVTAFFSGEKKEIPRSTMGWVDVRDVAELHIRMMEEPSASGRYLAIDASVPWEDACEAMRKIRPDLPIPTTLGEGTRPNLMLFDNARSVELLGRPFRRALEEVLPATLQSLAEAGLIPKPPQ